jgi:predicted TIM-barrel fold metal-dependent hydrolase
VRQEAWFDLGSTRADIPDVDLMADPLWRQGLNLLAPRALSFDLLVRGHQLGTAADVLREHPELIVAVDHLGLPGTDPDELALWRTGLRRVADEVPRSCLKLSGWSMFAPAWDSARVPPHLEEALEVFGPERCMLASNWPVEPRRDYHSYWEHLDRATCSLGASERSRLFSETASTCYRIDPPVRS